MERYMEIFRQPVDFPYGVHMLRDGVLALLQLVYQG